MRFADDAVLIRGADVSDFKGLRFRRAPVLRQVVCAAGLTIFLTDAVHAEEDRREAAVRASGLGIVRISAKPVASMRVVQDRRPAAGAYATADDGFVDAASRVAAVAPRDTKAVLPGEPSTAPDEVTAKPAAESKAPAESEVTSAVVASVDPTSLVAPEVKASAPGALPIETEPVPVPALGTRPETVVAPEKREREVFVITLVGDTGLNANRQRVRTNKAVRHGKGYDWAWTTKHVAPLIDGHLNFANIETVVTARNTLAPSSKKFNFRMHPNAARHLVDAGFNLFSLSNNHAADYGRNGILDTLKYSDALKFSGLRAHAGLGRDRAEALSTKTFSIGSARFGFAAMGIGAAAPGVSRAGINKPGQGNIYRDPDFSDTVDGLASSHAGYRIFSMHFGTERNVFPSVDQVHRWRDEVLIDRDIDLVVGHHAHVAQGVQMTDGKFIFFGLGNFLHLGTADMSRFNACRDYGMLARIFVVKELNGAMKAQAVQIVPLTGMHLQPKPMTGKRAGRRIDILNALATRLDNEATGSRGVRFTKQVDGTGLYCVPGAENKPGRLGEICQDYTPAKSLASSQRRRLLGMCGAPPRVSSATASKRKRRRVSQRKSKVWSGKGAFDKR